MISRDPRTHEPPAPDPSAHANQTSLLRAPPTFAASALAAAARHGARHLSGDDGPSADPHDRAELWGRRIGRALSLAGCIALAVYLYLTYVR